MSNEIMSPVPSPCYDGSDTYDEIPTLDFADPLMRALFSEEYRGLGESDLDGHSYLMETLESTLEELNSNDGLAIELEVSTESCGRAETTFNLSTGAEDEDMTREEASPAIYVSGVGENDAIADMDTNMGCCASAVVISDDELMEQWIVFPDVSASNGSDEMSSQTDAHAEGMVDVQELTVSHELVLASDSDDDEMLEAGCVEPDVPDVQYALIKADDTDNLSTGRHTRDCKTPVDAQPRPISKCRRAGKVYICLVDRCKYSYSGAKERDRHMLQHFSRRYKCPNCTSQFWRADLLIRHCEMLACARHIPPFMRQGNGKVDPTKCFITADLEILPWLTATGLNRIRIADAREEKSKTASLIIRAYINRPQQSL
ncbi:hypothetical protein AcV5_008736 [Taiwanofungus camphoratus]|nr:hypothetical protein AcV5_008736 [Antrodia cinnamomea]